MVSGRQVHSTVQEKVREVESQTTGLDRDIWALDKKLGVLSTEREQAYSRLADIYSPELTADSIEKVRQLPDIQKAVNAAFAEKQKRRAEIEVRMEKSTEKRKELEGKLDSVAKQIDTKIAERDKLRKVASTSLAENSEYITLVTDIKQKDETIKVRSRRLEEVETEAKEKLPAFDQNKLFSYLVNRGYTPKEEPQGLLEKLDSWVAGVVGFADAKKSYDYLRSMPKLMGLSIKNQRGELETIIERARTYEQTIADNTGLTKVMQEGAKIEAAKQLIAAEITKVDLEYKQYCSERAEMDGKKDPYHIELTQKLNSLIMGEDLGKLRARAKAFPGTEDDKLVDTIEKTEVQIAKLKEEVKKNKTERNSLGEMLDGLKQIERKTGRHTSSDDYYPSSFDIGSLLVRYIASKQSYDYTTVTSTIERSHKVKQPTYTPAPYSSPSSSSSDGGFGGGGFSSGGGFGGGGFTSGKGF